MGAEDGQVCAGYRLQTKGTDRLFRSAMALDRGAHLRLAGQLPSPGSGLRDQSSHERGLDQNRHDPPHATKTCLSILRQVLRASQTLGRSKRPQTAPDQNTTGRRQSSRSFFFSDTATSEIYTVSLHDALQ